VEIANAARKGSENLSSNAILSVSVSLIPGKRSHRAMIEREQIARFEMFFVLIRGINVICGSI
jgi:hypothetical protein